MLYQIVYYDYSSDPSDSATPLCVQEIIVIRIGGTGWVEGGRRGWYGHVPTWDSEKINRVW